MRQLTKNCNFGEVKDRILRDRIVDSIKNDAGRKKLLETKDLTLRKCTEVC